MAHTKSSDPSSKLTREINRGYRSRRIKEIPFIVADARTNMAGANHALADAIAAETTNKAIMIAPCAGKLLRVYVNAVEYPTAATSVQVVVWKAGASNVAMNTFISANNPTDKTAIDGVLSAVAGATSFTEGQLIYAAVAVVGAVNPRSDAMVIGIEWTPTER